MAQRDKPAIETLKATEAREQWSALLNRVFKQEAQVVVEKSGIPVAAVISYRDFEFFQYLLDRRDERFKVIDEIREAFRDIPEDELEREIAKAVSEARQEVYAEYIAASDAA